MVKKFAIAVISLAFAAPVLAAECKVEIEGNDAMKYNKDSIEVSKSCKEFTVTLKHVGKMPKASMGHNWVLSTEADMKPITAEAIKEGPGKDYLKADDSRIIAHTKLLGGGETDSVTFDVSKLTADGKYMFYCTFPGHAALMKGVLKLVD